MAFDLAYNQVSLLLHCDGANGSTTFSDSSPRAKTISVGGAANTSTTVSKFGGASAVFATSGDYLTCPTSSDFNFGSADFTIEFWMYSTSNATIQKMYVDGTSGAGAAGNVALGLYNNVLIAYLNGSLSITGSSISLNTWCHVALARAGTSLRLFVNGGQAGGTQTDSTVLAAASSRPALGADGGLINPFIGYMDDIRVTKGVARYTANFTPPTGPFSNSTALPDILKTVIGPTAIRTFNLPFHFIGN